MNTNEKISNTLSLELDLQLATEVADLPSRAEFELWLNSALSGHKEQVEITIRIVDNQESQSLNNQYRGKDRPTNVLSFPFEAPAEIALPLLGDLVICAPVVAQEAKQQNKSLTAHWAHMVVHGCLHLLGYDHIEEEQAEQMESLEIQLLNELGFNNPYKER